MNDSRRKRQQLSQGFPAFQNQAFGQTPYENSQSTSNANSNSFGFGPNGFGAANALAQAQGNFSVKYNATSPSTIFVCFYISTGFQAQGPLGQFGASAANTITDSFQAGPGGIQVRK